MNLIKQLAGQTAIYGLSSVVARIFNYLLVPVYTRVFSKSEYGLVTELYAYIAILMVVLTYGLETGYFRFVREKVSEGIVFSTAFISLFATSFIFVILISLYSLPIAAFLGTGHRQEFIILLSCVICIDVLLALPFAKLRFELKARKFAVFRVISIGINIFLNLFFLILIPFLESKYPGNKLAQIFPVTFGVGYIFVSNLFASFFILLLFLPSIFKIKMVFDFRLFANLIRYSFPLLIAGLAGILNETVDRIFLKYRLDELSNPLEQLGIYGANIKIAVFMTLFIQMYRFAAEPFFFKLYSTSKKDFNVNYSVINRLFIYTGLVIFLTIAFYINIFQLFIGEEFRVGISIVPIFLFSNLLLGVFFNLSFWYKLNGNTWNGAYLTFLGVLITSLINFFFIPYFGYYASAWAHVICNSTLVIISYFLSRKFFHFDLKVGRILISAVFALLLFFIESSFDYENIFLENLIKIALLFIFIILIIKIEGISMKRIKEIVKN